MSIHQNNMCLKDTPGSECHVVGGAHTSCIQPRLTAIQFSHIWTTKEIPQIHIKEQYAGGCGAMV